MTKLFPTMLLLSAVSMTAWAEEPTPADCSTLEGDAKAACEAEQSAKEAEAAKAELEALGDCSDKEGDDKAACEAKKAELEAKTGAATEPPAPAKGGKAQRSDTNRMEVVNEDE